MSYSSVKCSKCNLFYNDSRKQWLGTCEHTICLSCKESLLNDKCPICEKEGAFKDTVINYKGLEAQWMLRKEVTGDNWLDIQKKHEESMEKDLYSGPCAQCKAYSRQLRISIQSDFVEKCNNRFHLKHETWNPISAFQKAKGSSICADCVLASDSELKDDYISLKSVNFDKTHFLHETKETLKVIAVHNSWMESEKNPKYRFLHFIKTNAIHFDNVKHSESTIPECSYFDVFSSSQQKIIRDLQLKNRNLKEETDKLQFRLISKTKKMFSTFLEKARQLLKGENPEENEEIELELGKMEAEIQKIPTIDISEAEIQRIDALVKSRILEFLKDPKFENFENIYISQLRTEETRILDKIHNLQVTMYEKLKKLEILKNSENSKNFETFQKNFQQILECQNVLEQLFEAIVENEKHEIKCFENHIDMFCNYLVNTDSTIDDLADLSDKEKIKNCYLLVENLLKNQVVRVLERL